MTGLSHKAVTHWSQYARHLVSQMVLATQQQHRIGGPGVEVQIDESKFGKRKVAANGRGHRVEGAWVFGGVEQGGNTYGNNRYFAVVVEDRKASTLLPLIYRFIRPGSIIKSDCSSA